MDCSNSNAEEVVRQIEEEEEQQQQQPSSNQAGEGMFEFSWKPEGPAGLQFMSLLPVGGTLTCEYRQEEPALKMSTSRAHRRQRLKIISCGRTSCKNRIDEKRLCTACNQNDYIAAVELLDGGADPSCADEKRRTPLHFAASQGFESLVKLLLDRGADPNKKDFIGNTPLHLAACTCQVSIVTLLLKAGTDIKSVDQYGRTPLTLAKSRLKMLSQERSSNSDKMRGEIIQISEMMKTYLELSGCHDDASQLESLCQQLETSTSLDEVNHVNSLLSDFASMSIEKKVS